MIEVNDWYITLLFWPDDGQQEAANSLVGIVFTYVRYAALKGSASCWMAK
ncbi:Uncharacterized protein APZ42_030406 [Daphnia magna]|uniref:Uncharacterized protein n=1 Tax=Daphnia magna TaxID=35525 RepID=A0A162D340_9CRUS|nr:Uncharacterized protein APZ42_030406 [Daphnia magna]